MTDNAKPAFAGTSDVPCSVCGKRHSFAELATMVGDRLDDAIAAINAADMQIPPPGTKIIRFARYPKPNAEHEPRALASRAPCSCSQGGSYGNC